jgi:hypothetical protein
MATAWHRAWPASLLLVALLAGPASAQRLPVHIGYLPESILSQIDLSDPRLDPAKLTPPSPEWEKLIREQPDLEAQLQASMFQGLFHLDATGRAGDPSLPDATRIEVGKQVLAYRDQLNAWAAGQGKLQEKDPLHYVKVHTAEQVARDFVGKKSGPRGGGILPTYRCTEPEDFSRAVTMTVQAAQRYILKKKYEIDWTPPPALPFMFPPRK